MSGKTTLAKKLAKRHKLIHNRPIIVLDPVLDPDWQADFITDDEEEFLQAYWRNKNCSAFFDEGGDIGRYNKAMDKTATRGRHWGHKNFYICQRAKMISTNIRTQCSDIAIFKTSYDDSKDLANEFVEPMINEANNLGNGEFIYVRNGEKTVKLNVFEL